MELTEKPNSPDQREATAEGSNHEALQESLVGDTLQATFVLRTKRLNTKRNINHTHCYPLLVDEDSCNVLLRRCNVLQKNTFHIYWNSADFDVIFYLFYIALGPVLMSSGALETGLQIHDI